MPETPKSNQSSEEEIQISLAMKAIENGECKSVADASRRFQVPYQKLRRRRSGTRAITENGGNRTALSSEQNAALLQYIDRCRHLGRPPTKQTIKAAARTILQLSNRLNKLGKKWWNRWKKRHAHLYKTVRAKPLAAERKAAVQRLEVHMHFQSFEREKARLGIRDENVYNFDETGFRIDCQSARTVLVPIEMKTFYMADPGNRDLITSVECVSAEGWAIPPMIIIPGVIFKEKHFKNNLHSLVLLAASENGYNNDRLGYEWIQHFDLITRIVTPPGEWRMLIMDGHGSHLTYEFVKFCWDKKIMPFLLPAHSTHLLQPLDIGVFQPLKHHHQEVLDEEIRTGGIDFSKDDFLAAFREIRQRSFRTTVIKSAFAKAGLVPFNPQPVLMKLVEFNGPEQITPPPPQASYDYGNPKTPPSDERILDVLDELKSWIDCRLEKAASNELQITPRLQRIMACRDKAARTIALDGLNAQNELQKKAKAELEKSARRTSNRTVQKYGPIYVGDGRLKMIARNEREL
jgi:hypothetical protein